MDNRTIDEIRKSETKLINELQQKDKAIDECIELLGSYKLYTLPNVEQNSKNEDIAYNILQKLKQAKGGCDDERNSS